MQSPLDSEQACRIHKVLTTGAPMQPQRSFEGPDMDTRYCTKVPSSKKNCIGFAARPRSKRKGKVGECLGQDRMMEESQDCGVPT